MFSFKSFAVFGLTFSSLVHVEFIFVYGVRKCSNFIFTCISPVFPKLLVKKTVFPVFYGFAPLVIELTIGLCVFFLFCFLFLFFFFLGFLSCSNDLYIRFCFVLFLLS